MSVAIQRLAGQPRAGVAEGGRPLRRRIAGSCCGRALLPMLLMVAAAAAAADTNSPVQYVDDQTGASITAVGRPLLFAHMRSESVGARDYVTVAGAAIDQSGKFSYVLLGYFWSVGVPEESAAAKACRPLAVELADGRIELAPRQGAAHDAGIGMAVHRPPFGANTPCVYPVDLTIMQRIAQSAHPVLYSEGSSASVQYDLFEDRLGALKELVQQLKNSG